MDGVIEAGWFRKVLGQYPTGVCVVTATQHDGSRAGFVVGSFTSVSLDPPLVAFFPDKKSSSWPKIERAGRFCVNILGADQEEVCRQFASKAQDKFLGIGSRESTGGSPIIDGVVAWIDCDLESVQEAGDHYIVLGRVRELNPENPSHPLLFFQGSYGRFASHSVTVAGVSGELSARLRQADLIRPDLERLAATVSARCILATAVDADLIVLGDTGAPNTGARSSLVGACLPQTALSDSALAAWFSDQRADRADDAITVISVPVVDADGAVVFVIAACVDPSSHRHDGAARDAVRAAAGLAAERIRECVLAVTV